MNRMIIFISFIISIVLVNFGISTKEQVNNLKDEDSQLVANNLEIRKNIKNRGSLVKREGVQLLKEYNLVMNQVRLLESNSGTDMNVQLEAGKDVDDISEHFTETKYRGVRGLKIKIVVDKFSKETDMAAVLDDIYSLERHTDFLASDISKDNDNLIVKGEIYGL